MISVFHATLNEITEWDKVESEDYFYGDNDHEHNCDAHKLYVFKRKDKYAENQQLSDSDSQAINVGIDRMETLFRTADPWKSIYDFGMYGGAHATPTNTIKWLFQTINLRQGIKFKCVQMNLTK